MSVHHPTIHSFIGDSEWHLRQAERSLRAAENLAPNHRVIEALAKLRAHAVRTREATARVAAHVRGNL